MISALPEQQAETDRLGPRQALELAILGLVCSRPAALGDLQVGVAEIGGCCWRPAVGVIADRIEELAGSGQLRIAFADNVGAPPAVHATGIGRHRLRELLLMEIGDHSEILCHTYVLLKVAFIDHLEPNRRWQEIDRLIEVLQAGVAALTNPSAPISFDSPYLRLARTHEIGRMESEICWLRAVRDSVVRDLALSA